MVRKRPDNVLETLVVIWGKPILLYKKSQTENWRPTSRGRRPGMQRDFQCRGRVLKP
jgi:hypothetical protein